MYCSHEKEMYWCIDEIHLEALCDSNRKFKFIIYQTQIRILAIKQMLPRLPLVIE